MERVSTPTLDLLKRTKQFQSAMPMDLEESHSCMRLPLRQSCNRLYSPPAPLLSLADVHRIHYSPEVVLCTRRFAALRMGLRAMSDIIVAL